MPGVPPIPGNTLLNYPTHLCPRSGTWGIILDIKKVALLSASLRVREAFSCNVSPVVAASCVIAGAEFVPRSGEGTVWTEVVKAICCPNPRFIELLRNPVGSVSFAVGGKHVLRLHH